MSSRNRGRHRAPGPLNPAANFTAAVVRHAGPAAHVSAVLVASGGVVATLAAPAYAGTEATTMPANTGDRPAATSAQAAAGVAGGAAERPGSAYAAPAGQQGVGAGAGTMTRAEKRQIVRVAGTAGALQDVTNRAATVATLARAARSASQATATATPTGTTAHQTLQAVARTTDASRPATTDGPAATKSTAATASSATTADTPVIKTSTPATGLSAASATSAITRTVEFAGARSRVVSSQALAKRLDRTGVRSRSAAAGAALNTSFPVLTRAIARTARSQTSTVQLGGAARGSSAVSIASGLTGIWYRWGGSSPSGFDCSGYTSYVYRKMGIRLPRTAAAQQAYTKRVRTPRPGDLVFFGAPAHHVGIYAGGGMMYDAPSRGRKTQLRKVYTSRVTYGRIG